MRSETRSPEEIERTMKAYDNLTTDLDGLLDRLSDTDEDVRAAVSSRLANFDEPRVVQALLSVLEDEHPRVRGAAALSLYRLKSHEAAEALARHLRSDPSEHVRRFAAIALGRIGGQIAWAALRDALTDHDSHVRSASCNQFVLCPDLAPLDHIFQLLADPEWECRYTTAHVLVKLNVPDERIVRCIEELRQIPEAVERARTFAELDVALQVHEDCPESSNLVAAWIDTDVLPNKDAEPPPLLQMMRIVLGEEKVPPVPADPLGDLAEKARALLTPP